MHFKSKIVCYFLLFFGCAQSFAVKVQQKNGVMIAEKGQEKSVFRTICDPRSTLQNDLEPVRMIRQLYNVDINECLTVLKARKMKCGHCSMCAITYVYKTEVENEWLLETSLFESLFVSGAHGENANGMYALLGNNLNLNFNNIPINTVLAFPSKNCQSDSHSERAIVSFLTNNINDIQPKEQTPHFVAIHMKNCKPSCLACYNAIANARSSQNKFGFQNGTGLIDVFSRENLEDYQHKVSVIVGIGHCHAKQNQTNIDWLERW